MSMDREEKQLQTTLAFLHETMKEKKVEYNAALQSLDQFTHLDQSDVTSGGQKLRGDILKNGKLNMYAIQGNINAYDAKLEGINDARQELKRQQSDFQDLISTFYGENKILQDFEFEKMKKYGEDVLGWKYDSAGAKAELAKLGTSTERGILAEERAYRTIENQKIDAYIQNDLVLLQSLFQRDYEDPEAATKDGASQADKELQSWDDFAELDRWTYIDNNGLEKTAHALVLEEVSSLLAGGDAELFIQKIRTLKGAAYDEVREFLYSHPSTSSLMQNLELQTTRKRNILNEAQGVEAKDTHDTWQDLKSSHGRQHHIDDDFDLLYRNMHQFTESENAYIMKQISSRWMEGDTDATYKRYIEWFYASGYGDPNMASTPDWIRSKYGLPPVSEMGDKWLEEEGAKRVWDVRDISTDPSEHTVDYITTLGGGLHDEGETTEWDKSKDVWDKEHSKGKYEGTESKYLRYLP